MSTGWVLTVTQISCMGGGNEAHVGFVDRVFASRPEAAAFYDDVFVPLGLRPLNAHNTWMSDWDASTRLRFAVVKYRFQARLLPNNLRWAMPVPPGPLPALYGVPELVRIEETKLAQALMLETRRSSTNAHGLEALEAWKNNQLFGLQVHETDDLFRLGLRDDSIFLHDDKGHVAGFWHLPCYIALTPDGMDVAMLWVAPRARRKGLARLLVKASGITRVSSVLENSRPFWDAVGVTYDTVL